MEKDIKKATFLFKSLNFLARKEISAFQAQVLKSFKLPENFKLVVKSHSHDFGTYYELGASFEDTEEHWDFFYKLEDSLPKFWNEWQKKSLSEV